MSWSPLLIMSVSYAILARLALEANVSPENDGSQTPQRFLAKPVCQFVVDAQGYAWLPDGSEVRRFQVVAGQIITGVVITLKMAARVGGRLFTAGGGSEDAG
jgi:hypothetical protein